MPSTPTTKSQVQAYRFVLRRMQSALVRKDAVMLHEPMRMHTRATIAGVCVAAIGVVGFLIWGLLSPDPKPPNEDGIVISKQSGQVYVLISQPRQLIPTFNLASARLLLVARQQQQGQAQQGGTAAQLPSGTSTDLKEPTMVDEKELRDIPRGRLTGIQNGPDLLPNKDQRIDARWAVCDKYQLDPSLNNPASEHRWETTVLGGVADLGRELAEAEALLVQAPNKVVYLVYRTPTDANITNANAVRAEVDMSDKTVRAALKLAEQDVRQISTGLLNAIPEAPKLAAPGIPGRDTTPDGFDIKDLKVGEVFSIERAGQKPEYYVVHKNGIESIKQTTADLIRFTKSIDTGITRVSPDELAGVPPQNAINDTKSPEVQPEVLKAVQWPVACLGWNLAGEGDNTDHHTAVHVGSADVPLPKKPDGSTHQAISISTPSADGQRIDHFFMPPGRAAVVRGSTSREDFNKGPIYLVSDRGVKYGVPDVATAATLGLADQRPAPDSIMRLLPSGASLNTRDVLQTYDIVPVEPGTFPTQGQQAGGGG
jgi:type VII secretion protein EccB